MTLESVGAHFLHRDRDLHGRKSCTVECVQMDRPLPGYDELAVRGRVQRMLDKGVDIAIRWDYSSDDTFPPDGDEEALRRFNTWLQGMAADPLYGRARWFIIGNEPNLNGTSPLWVARCVTGFGRDSGDTSNAYQYITAVNPDIDVLLPAVAPWSPAANGDLGAVQGDVAYPVAPDGRPGLMMWETYMAALAWRAFNNNWHVPYEKVHFALHIYSDMAGAGYSADEPLMDLRNPGWMGAHTGSRVFEDWQYLLVWAADGAMPATLISEWNTYLNDQWPCQNYVPGLLPNLIRNYLRYKDNLMGFASFVDENWAGGCPNWVRSAIAGYLDTSGCMTPSEKHRLAIWDQEFDEVLRNGY